MKILKFLAVAVVILSSFPILFGQQADAHVQQSTSASAGSTQVNQANDVNAASNRKGTAVNGQSATNSAGAVNGSANGGGAAATNLRSVNGQLEGKLDSKTAKVGDPVVVKTTQKARTADGTVIPKGSRLTGHVTDVQAHGKGSQDSHMAIQFDRAELRGGQSMAIHSVIQSVSPASNAAMSSGFDNDDSFGGGPALGGGGMRGGGGGAVRGGGGLLGGAGAAAGGTVSAVGSTTGNLGSGVGSTVHGAAGVTGNAAGNVAGGTANLGGAAAGSGLLTVRPTGIPGVMLAGDASGAASGTLSASRRNVHLDSGTNMVLGVGSAVSQ